MRLHQDVSHDVAKIDFVTGLSTSLEALNETEYNALKTLKWRIFVPTVMTWLSLFCDIWSGNVKATEARRTLECFLKLRPEVIQGGELLSAALQCLFSLRMG